jgi:hypothetical protein
VHDESGEHDESDCRAHNERYKSDSMQCIENDVSLVCFHFREANVCDEGRRHAQRGAVPSAPCWNPNVLSSLLQNQPEPTPRAATIFRHADRDLRNKRSPRHAERSACRAITRGSGGEQPTHIYCIPTSAVWGADPPRGCVPTTALLADPNFFPVLWTIQNRPGSHGH